MSLIWCFVTMNILGAVAAGTCPSNCLPNADCESEPDKGCPKCQRAYYGRECQHRMECTFTSSGAEYRGLLNKTRYNTLCRNQCRNYDNSTFPWCAFLDSVSWDYCSIPLCNTQCTSPPLPPGSYIMNPALPGEGFTDDYVAQIMLSNGTLVQSICQAGLWSTINGVKCKPLQVSNVIVQPLKDIYQYNDTITVKCRNGYETRNTALLSSVHTCIFENKWSGKFILCHAVHCLRPLLQNSSILKPNRSTYEHNTIISITCMEGFETKDETILHCLSNRTWSHRVPKCLPKEEQTVHCLQPLLQNSSILKPNRSTYEHNTIISITCMEGFETKDETILHCLSNKTWSHRVPKCLPKEEQKMDNTLKIIAGTVSSVVIITFCICLGLYIRYRQRRNQASGSDHYEMYETYDPDYKDGAEYSTIQL